MIKTSNPNNLMGGVLPQGRDERLDSIKFCLIVLVIAGHVFSNSAFKDVFLNRVIWKYIYMFHMPLFVFLSGYFSHKKRDFLSFRKSIFKILEPLIIIQALLIVKVFFETKSISVATIFTPWWVMWYLLSLIYWRTMLYILPEKVLKHKKLILIVSFSIAILAGFFPFNRFLSIQRTLAYLPFFFLGYCLQGKKIHIPSKYKWLCLFLLCSAFLVPIYLPAYLYDLNNADPYLNIYSMFSRIFVFCMSAVMSISFICICPKNKFFAQQGKFTLHYYIYHAIILTLLHEVFSRFNLSDSTLVAGLCTLFVILSIWLLLHFSIFRKLTNPSSFFIEE